MASFFISYCNEDGQGAAKRLQKALKAKRHVAFLDHARLRLGEKWRVRLVDEIRAADAVIPIVTPNFHRSPWCVAEVATARAYGVRILPLACAGGDPTQIPFLDEAHYDRWEPDASEPAERRPGQPLTTDQLIEKLTGGPGGVYAAWLLGDGPDSGSPFPGLEHFRSGMWWAYYGRDQETNDVVRRLRTDDVQVRGRPVFMVGSSGCGKSSLARAGVLPRMLAEPGWSALRAVVPGRAPVSSLCEALAQAGRQVGLGWSTPDVERRARPAVPGDTNGAIEASVVREGLRGVVADFLERSPEGQRDRLLVVLDQVEETLSAGEEARASLGLLVRATRDTPVRLLMTVRSEYFDELLRLLELRDVRPYWLSPLAAEEHMRQVILEPARQAGIGVTGDLVDRLVADTGGGDALPLLAFVLNRLADGVREGETIDLPRYEAVGRVADALTGQADEALEEREKAGRSRSDVLSSLLELVVVTDDPRRPTRGRRAWEELPDEKNRADLDAFEERRLVTKFAGDNGKTYVTVTHEAFLAEWPTLAQAIEGEAALLVGRQKVLRAAEEWDASGRSRSLLWSLERISSAVLPEKGLLALARSASGPVSAVYHLARRLIGASPHLPPPFTWVGQDGLAVAFLDASYRRGLARRHRWVALLLAVLLSLLVATVALAHALASRESARNASAERCEAITQGLIQRAQTLRDDQPLAALQLSVVAFGAGCALPLAADNLVSVQDLTYTRYLDGGFGTAVHAVAADPVTGRLALATEAGTGAGDVHLADPHGGIRVLPYPEPVYAVAFSPDGELLALGGRDGGVEVWDAAGRDLLARVDASSEPATAVAFTPGSGILVTGSQDGLLRRWDPRTGAELGGPMRDNGQPVFGVAVSPDGTRLAAAGADGDVDVWDPESANLVVTLRGHTGPVRAVAFGPDGTTLASGADDASIRLWNIDAAEATAMPVGHNDSERALALAETTAEVMVGHNDKVRALAFSPDGLVLASGGEDATARLWDVPSGQHLRALAGPPAAVTGLAFVGAGGLTLAGASADGKLGLWDVGHGGADSPFGLGAVAVYPGDGDGDVVATAAPGRPITIWDRSGRTGPLIIGDASGSPPGGSGVIAGISFSPDGERLAAPIGAEVWIWRTSDGEPVHRLTGHTGPVHAVAFSPDGRFLASGGQDATVRVWDTADLAADPRTISEHFGPVRSVAFSPDGSQLASGSDDGTVSQVPLDPGEGDQPIRRHHHLPPVEAVAFSRDGRMLAAGSQDRTVSLWDAANPDDEPTRVLTGHRQGVVAVAFDPERDWLASVSSDGEIRVHDIGSGFERGGELVVVRTRDGATSVAFTPDGRHLVTTARSGVPRVWALDPAAIAEEACGRDLLSEDQEWQQYVTDPAFQRPCSRTTP